MSRLDPRHLPIALSMLPDRLRERMKVHFCGPTGANAVDAAIKLCKTATGRGDSISFQGGFHGSSHAAMAVAGLVDQKRPVPNGVPGIHFLPTPTAAAARWPSAPTPAPSTASPSWSGRSRIYDERLDVWAPGAHTGTFRGNQLAFATGAEAVRIIRRDDVLNNVRRRGQQLADR